MITRKMTAQTALNFGLQKRYPRLNEINTQQANLTATSTINVAKSQQLKTAQQISDEQEQQFRSSRSLMYH